MNRLFADIRTLQITSAIFFVVLVVSALLVSKQSYQTRKVYKEIEVVYRDSVSLETLQGKLRIERGSLLSPAYVEAHARYELAMQEPSDPNLVRRLDLRLSAKVDEPSYTKNKVAEIKR